MNTNDHSTFLKDVFFIEVSHFIETSTYYETNGPCLFENVSNIPTDKQSFLIQDATILKCLERVRALGFYKIKKMPIDAHTHHFDEVTYKVDGLNVKALMMTPVDQNVIQRIVIYLRGGKGQVGRVRAARLMQFANEHTIVIGPYYRGNNGSEGKDEFYRGDLNDVTQLIRLLHDKYPSAYIHMIGFSRGGLQGLLTFQDLPVNSFIIWGGVSDIHLMYEERVDLRGMLRRMVGHPKKIKTLMNKETR